MAHILRKAPEMNESRLERIMEAGFTTLADLARETNSRLDETNTRLHETNLRLNETNFRLGRLEGRFDHFLETVGAAWRDLDRRVAVLEGAK